MALSPKDCGKLTPEDIEAVVKAENAIDEQLREKYAGFQITVAIFIALSSKQLNNLKERYIKAGWKSVNFSGADQRDSTEGIRHYIILSETVPVNSMYR